MLRNYYRQLLAFILFITSIAANGQGFGVSTSARYADGCRLDFYNSTNVKIFSLRGSELRYTYNSSGQIIVRDENTQITDVFGISGLAALIDSVQSVCLAGLCSGGSTPVETFSYCYPPILDYFARTYFSPFEVDSFSLSSVNLGYVIPEPDQDSAQAFIKLFQAGQTFSNRFGVCFSITEGYEDYLNCLNVFGASCSEIDTNSFYFKLNEADFTLYNDNGYPIVNEYTLTNIPIGEKYPLLVFLQTVSQDTVLSQNITIFGVGSISQGNEAKRSLGVSFTDIVVDTATATITLTATPAKTSGTIYATSSFKIEKIAFADITAGTISGSTYNPNSGDQSNTFSLTTGKNTFKVSVEDTDGNVAYSIFQVSKTAL